MISKREPADKFTFQIPPGHADLSRCPWVASTQATWCPSLPKISGIEGTIKVSDNVKEGAKMKRKTKINHVSNWSNHIKVSFNSDNSFVLFSALRHLWQSGFKRQRDNINCRICSNVSGLQLLCFFLLFDVFSKGLFFTNESYGINLSLSNENRVAGSIFVRNKWCDLHFDE